jgi:hypothetical protein
LAREQFEVGHSSLAGMCAPRELVTKSGQELERGFVVRLQGWLFLHPRLGVRERLENAPTSADGSLDQSPVDEKQENDCSLVERHCRPVGGVGQVVFQVQSGVPNGLPEKSGTMLVIAVQAIMSEVSDPKARQLTDK